MLGTVHKGAEGKQNVVDGGVEAQESQLALCGSARCIRFGLSDGALKEPKLVAQRGKCRPRSDTVEKPRGVSDCNEVRLTDLSPDANVCPGVPFARPDRPVSPPSVAGHAPTLRR
jgi:hypothetical protein